MTAIVEEVIEVNRYKLHLIPNKKFKTINIVVKFKAALQRETITHRALLPYVLQQGPKQYPSKTEFQKKLDSLYGAVLSMDSAKKGEHHIISLRLEVANQKYLSSEADILSEAIVLLNSVIFNPNVSDNAFQPTIFNREKETLKQKINSIIDDKMQYANMRLIDEMCKDEPYHLHVHGYEEDLDSMTSEDLFQYYSSLVQNDQLDIYVLGDFETEVVRKLITSTINRNNSNQPAAPQSTSNQEVMQNKPNEVIEAQTIQQAKLHLGYRTHSTYKDDDYFALQVFNGVLGGFPSSKLFINVREKNSLAYYASSRLESHKGLLLIFSGIAPSDYEKAREIIELQIAAIKQGDFTEAELSETKELIVNQLLETLDHPQGIIEMLYQQVIANKILPPNMLIDKIKQVSKDEVIEIAHKLEEDTVYLLTNKGGHPLE